MIKHLRQFEKESGIELYGLGKDREKWEDTLSKFAALIVNECIQELGASMRGDPYLGDVYDCEYNTCIDDQIIILKERFGVE